MGYIQNTDDDRKEMLRAIGVSAFPDKLHYAGGSSSVLGREGSLEETNVFDCVGVEGAEHPEEVIDVVDSHAVEENQVLIGRAAADIEAGRTLVCATYARKQLQ